MQLSEDVPPIQLHWGQLPSHWVKRLSLSLPFIRQGRFTKQLMICWKLARHLLLRHALLHAAAESMPQGHPEESSASANLLLFKQKFCVCSKRCLSACQEVPFCTSWVTEVIPGHCGDDFQLVWSLSGLYQ